ncbi:hypothetical protein Y032_0009g572 [Ancylostoma ceylanicum]|uniref:Uncharacterized protein n=1 Tax=Ancylostoma ceylanicum TaxID=53326 RepID=A0A016VIT8_9BILA|nr:hypothetical protein Y032_0009g572 [Ancylostoma ceylanicum]
MFEVFLSQTAAPTAHVLHGLYSIALSGTGDAPLSVKILASTSTLASESIAHRHCWRSGLVSVTRGGVKQQTGVAMTSSL